MFVIADGAVAAFAVAVAVGAVDDRASIDNFYIDHWYLWEDVKILLRTIGSVIRMRGH
jgi:lipopolysaccharide/colanic/teichoic acid biosynthesis glycosyltransferase